MLLPKIQNYYDKIQYLKKISSNPEILNATVHFRISMHDIKN